MNIAKFLRISILKNICERLLLKVVVQKVRCLVISILTNYMARLRIPITKDYSKAYYLYVICLFLRLRVAQNALQLSLFYLRLLVTQKALQLSLFAFFFSTANLDGLTKVVCRIFQIC